MMNADDRPLGMSTRYIPPELRAPRLPTDENESSSCKNKKMAKLLPGKMEREIGISSAKRVESNDNDNRRPASYGEKYTYDDENGGSEEATTLFDVANGTAGSKSNSSQPKTIKEAATRLSDSKSYSWKLRLSAIEWLQNLVKDVEEHDQIVMSLVMLSNPLIAQCRDLRSAIVRETCNLLKLFASNLGDRFASIAPAITKHLLMITGGGNKVIAGYCGECAQEIVKNTQSKKSIALFVSLIKSRSKVVREKSLMCLCICLEVWSPTNWLHNTKNINAGITRGLNDPSPTAREIAKRAYTAFELHSPEDAQALVATLDKRTLSKLNSVHSSKSLKSKGRKSSNSGSFSSSIKSHRRPSSLDSTLIRGHESVDQGQVMGLQPPPSPPSAKECKEWVLTQRVKGDPVCYWNSRTNQTSHTGHWIPLFKEIENNLEPGKEKNIDRKRFYYNLETKETSWHLPEKDRSPRNVDSNTPTNLGM